MEFKDWQKHAVSVETRALPNTIRDVYILPNGIWVMEDWITPYSFLKKSFSIVVVNHRVPMDTKIDKAEVSDDYYTEDGFGVPVFRGDNPMEDAYNYAMKLTKGI